MTAEVCAFCARVLPLGGVLDAKGRRVHDWCKGVAAQRIAEDAQATAKVVAKQGKPKHKPSLALEGASA